MQVWIQRWTRRESLALAFVAGLFATGCDAGPRGAESFGEARPLMADDEPVRLGVSTAERFGYAPAEPRDGGDEAGGLAQGSWSVPDGWVEVPPTAMRSPNFLVAGDPDAQCYLTSLAGDGGGLESNVNRWRSQMSLAPVSAAEIGQLPRVPFLGGVATFLDLEGNWTGMSGDESGEDYRLVGLLLVEPTGSHFLKMIGPQAILAGELEAFEELAASLGNPEDVIASQETQSDSAGGITWSAPAGWARGPERSMRAVTYFVDPQGEAECYVTLLGGDGGGAEANIMRWVAQMGATPLTSEQLANLERVPMLGTEGLLVEADGSYQGMNGENIEGARLLGTVCLLPNRAVFVKLIGPRAIVDGAREDFIAFCESLKEVR